MLKKVIQKRLLLLCSLFVAVICFLGFGFLSPSSAEETGLQESYSVGETLSFPERTLSHGGESAKAETIVYFPDGTAMNTRAVLLEQAGVYTVEYRATIGDTLVKERETFTVVDNSYASTGSKTTVRYGTDESVHQTGHVGLSVALAENETFTFNQVVDLDEHSAGNFMTFYLLPKNVGVRDASAMWITLTDVRDSNNYLTVKIQSVAYQGNTYVYGVSYALASPNGQMLIAQDYSEANRVHVNDRFGQAVYCSFYGNSNVVQAASGKFYGPGPAEEYVALQYKPEERQIWINSYKANCMIVDFDDPKYTQYLDGIWDGFTTNEVRVSVHATGYVGSAFNFLVTDFAGLDLAKEALEDGVAPVITVDTEGYDENDLPTAVKGYSYPVFQATAFDTLSGYTNVTARAYFAYDSTSRVEVDIVDGRVDVKREGMYAIVYTSSDFTGNTSEKVLRFKTAETPNPSIAVTGGATETTVGDRAVLADVSHSGGSGELELTVTAKLNGKVYELDGEYFRPEEAGRYEITYTVTDVTGRTASETKILEVSANPTPVFMETAVYPEYLLYGQKFEFAFPKAYDYTAREYVEVALYVNGNAVENPYAPTETGEIKVKYVATSGEYSTATEEATVKVVNVFEKTENGEYLNMERYFQGENVTVSQLARSVQIEAVEGASSVEVDYVKSLLMSNFELSIEIDPEKNEFSTFEIVLANAEAPSETLTIGLCNDTLSQATYYTLNGESTPYKAQTGGFYGGKTLRFTFNNGLIYDNGSFTCKAAELLPATKYLLTLRMSGIEGKAAITVSNVNGQYLIDGFSVENHKPQLQLLGEYPGQAELGEKLEILPIIVEDILDTETRALVTVTDPEGNDVISKADGGVAHSLTLDQYGVYFIEYTLYNYSGRKETYYQAITVRDTIAPVITVKKSIKSSYQKGSSVTLPDFSVRDNLSDGDAITTAILVLDGKGKLSVLDGRKIMFSEVGTYTIRYFAQDEAGNIAIKEYTVKVEG